MKYRWIKWRGEFEKGGDVRRILASLSKSAPIEEMSDISLHRLNICAWFDASICLI